MEKHEIDEYFRQVDEIIEKHGHYIQGVVEESVSSLDYYYTVGRYKEGFELIAFTKYADLAHEALNQKEVVPFRAYESECMTHTGSDKPTRYGFVEVIDHLTKKVIYNLLCLGWRRKFDSDNIPKLYVLVMGDKDNLLCWETNDFLRQIGVFGHIESALNEKTSRQKSGQ